MAAPHRNNLPGAGGERPSPAAQQVYLQLSALEAEIFMLKMSGPSSPGILEEIEKTRAKRERIYREFQRNLHQLQDLSNGDGNESTVSPAGGMQASK